MCSMVTGHFLFDAACSKIASAPHHYKSGKSMEAGRQQGHAGTPRRTGSGGGGCDGRAGLAGDRLAGRRVADVHEQPGLAADLLRRLPGATAADALAAMSDGAAGPVVAALEPVTAASLLARLEQDVRRRRITALDPLLAKELTELMAYPPDVAGGLMDPRAATFRPHTTAREALTRIRAMGDRQIHDVFLVDEEGRLTGAVGLHDLALAEPGTRLESLATARPVRVQAMAPQEDVVAIAELVKAGQVSAQTARALGGDGELTASSRGGARR